MTVDETTPLVTTTTTAASNSNNNNNTSTNENESVPDVLAEISLRSWNDATYSSTTTRNLHDFYSANSFLLKAIMAVLAAKLYPPLGATYLHPEITSTWIAVVFIFVMAGLSFEFHDLNNTDTAATRRGCFFNTFVLVLNFGVPSLLVFGTTLFLRRQFNLVSQELTDGMFVCACMPISINMVIVLTKFAKGDQRAAVSLAAIGSLLGLVVSPTLILLYIGVEPAIDITTNLLVKLVLRIIVPTLVGQLLKLSSTVVELMERYKNYFKSGQEWASVYIVYTAFCKSFFASLDTGAMGIFCMAVAEVMILLVSMLLAWYSLKILFRNEPRLRVMGLYGCTQKSVAIGIPLIGAVYGDDPRAGMFILPLLLIWHPVQLLIGSALAPRLAEGVDLLEQHLSSVANHQRRPVQRRSFFSPPTSNVQRRASSVAFESPLELVLEWEEEEDEDENVGTADSVEQPSKLTQ